MTKQLFNCRVLAIICIGVMTLVFSKPSMAQFDEPSRNQWVIDFSYGFTGDSDGKIFRSDDCPSYYSNVSGSTYDFSSISISFGLNRRLFHNFYAGARIGYKYYSNGGSVSWYQNRRYDSEDIHAKHHLLIVPIEFGYNHTFSHKNGLNIYISAIPGFDCAAGVSAKMGHRSYFATDKPGLCIDTAAGLRYYIRHIYLGLAYHYGVNDAQKIMGKNSIEASIGYRF